MTTIKNPTKIIVLYKISKTFFISHCFRKPRFCLYSCKSVLIMLLFFTFSQCGTEEDPVPPPTIEISGTEITGSGSSYKINISALSETIRISIDIGGSATGWRVTGDVDRESSGTGDDVFSLTIDQNRTASERTYTVVFESTGGMGQEDSATLTVTQDAANEGFIIFWYDLDVYNTLDSIGVTTLTYYVDGIRIGSNSIEDGRNILEESPTCSEGSFITVRAELGNMNTRSYSFRIEDQEGTIRWRGNIEFTAGICTKYRLTG